jgi:hypothetical protein
MTRSNFARALVFALLAAALTLPVELFGAYSWGYEGSLGAYLLLLTPLALWQAAPDFRTGVRAFFVAGLVACVLLCSVSRLESALLGAILILALGRNALSGPRPFARVLAVELAIGALSFAAFATFHDRHFIGDVLAMWAFWLVQSGCALVTHTPPAHAAEHVDAFDAALSAADRLMQQR